MAKIGTLTIGEKLKLLRKRKNLTLIQAGKILKINPAQFSDYENNKRNPSVTTLRKIVDFYNIDFEYLYENKLFNDNYESHGPIKRMSETMDKFFDTLPEKIKEMDNLDQGLVYEVISTLLAKIVARRRHYHYEFKRYKDKIIKTECAKILKTEGSKTFKLHPIEYKK